MSKIYLVTGAAGFIGYNLSKYLLDKEEEIINICKLFNARAGINLNKRNFEKCSLQAAKLILDQIN